MGLQPNHPLSNIALFSQTPATTTITNLVNLNRPRADGSYPIIGGANPPDVSVQFVNVLQDPTSGPSQTNPIIGRYAFWIDDESAKININVADGTQKYTTNSLGLGSPTEVSLQVLPQDNVGIPSTLAQSIVAMARTTGFHSPREILRVSGTDTSLYNDNVFDLTDYSRSPTSMFLDSPRCLSCLYLANRANTKAAWSSMGFLFNRNPKSILPNYNCPLTML